ncbi:MAG: hypothetical protein IT574_06080 [Candidatus Aureabacteria bacterium]|nr:hypothetical protein [Candidatus Auribacterota bacterium]NLW94296.1 hypothetical protein [Chlamydiota bacterium]HOE26612.1 hypothetical protein [bacterium]HQM52453.1 hypothetical protein [bacterium]
MNGRMMLWCAALLAVALFCGCVGYFHYHPIKSTEQETAGPVSGRLFTGETSMGSGMGSGVTPAISAIPISEESLIK